MTHPLSRFNACLPDPRLRLGIDVVQVSRIEASVQRFGDRFVQRVFTAAEIADADQAPALRGQRLAARFAAKEAALKAFGWAPAGVGPRDIEVARSADGGCTLRLHGRAAERLAASGCGDISLSLSHDGDYAVATVVAADLSPGPAPLAAAVPLHE
ncbi:holo-ACP synthase [Eleftheria terrae]|uniref:holo-ACP synthase n=1 Tax=Eleftheria terrae TaxID=1597781 RepID=UPI00263B57B5|nr:holo-ACP synthase [Eleftheria terrae]WKB53375.1 holo-ACP synthase [Eleftheria terrae]